MRPHPFQQRRHMLRARQLNLPDSQRGARVELRALALQRVQRPQPEQIREHAQRRRPQRPPRLVRRQRLVEAPDNQILRVRATQPVEVHEQLVPRRPVLVPPLQRLKRQIRRAPRERRHQRRPALVQPVLQHVQRRARVLPLEEVAEHARGVVVRGLLAQDGPRRLQQVPRHLLREHVVVALPRRGGQVVGVEGPDAGEGRVPVAAARAATRLEALGGDRRRERLEPARCRVQVREQVASAVGFLRAGAAAGAVVGLDGPVPRHLRLVGAVEGHHFLAGEVQREGRGQEREQTDLHHFVVEHLRLGALGGGRVALFELAAHRAVADCDGDAPGEGRASFADDVGADEGEGAVDERGGGRAEVFAGLGVDRREFGEHGDMGDFDVAEEEEAVVHCVEAEFGADVTDVDVRKGLVRLEVAHLDDEGVWAV